MYKDSLKLKGSVLIKHIRDGRVIDKREDHNLIQNIGKTSLAKFITGEFTGNFGWMGIGKTGIGGPDGALTALVAEVGLDGLTTTVHQEVTSKVVTTYTALIIETFTMTGSAVISEIGLFNQLNLAGSTMLARQTFADLNLIATDSLQVSWSIVVS